MQMKDFALRYCKMGLSVIPINPRNKRPLIKFADQPSLTAERIEEIWRSFQLRISHLKRTNSL